MNSKAEVEDRMRREEDILDRIENVKRLIQMENTLMVSKGCGMFAHYKLSDNAGKAFGVNLLDELRDEIQLQLLSIVALCYGANPDIGEPMPILEWRTGNTDNRHPSDVFRDVFEQCLGWNA